MRLVLLKLREIFSVSSLTRMLDSSWKPVVGTQTLIIICFLVIMSAQIQVEL